MKQRTAILLCLIFPWLCFSTTPKQAGSAHDGPGAVLNQFLEFNNKEALQSQQARGLLTGEALLWEIPSFGKLALAPDSLVMLDAKNAAGRVQWFGENDFVADFYFYIRLDGKWKIHAMRRLALTGIVEDAFLYLKEKKDRTPDEEFQFRNSELTLATDSALRAWFEKHRTSLEKIVTLAPVPPKSHVVAKGTNDVGSPEVKRLLRNLNLGSLEFDEQGNLQIAIGGITDNMVGFIYSPLNRPPSIDPSGYIWVEKLADKWFLFRTT